jgi:hypothetical protein
VGPWLALLALLAAAAPAWADESDEETAAKQSENVLSNTVTLKLENTTYYLIGPLERTRDVLAVQAVLPLDAGAKLSVIAIPTIPLVWQPDNLSRHSTTFGLGDIGLRLYLGPKSRSIVSFGVGPAFRFPTATDKGLASFDSGMLSLGATSSLVFTVSHFVFGIAVSNVWSLGGRDSGKTVNAFVLDPFFDYNLPSGWYLVTSPTITCNWTVPDNQGWVVPVGAGFGKVSLLSPKVALGFEVHAYYHAVRAEFDPLWNLRFQASLSFPKLPPKPRSP